MSDTPSAMSAARRRLDVIFAEREAAPWGAAELREETTPPKPIKAKAIEASVSPVYTLMSSRYFISTS
jgi:hypothetical protein